MGGESSQLQPAGENPPTKLYEVRPNIIIPHNHPAAQPIGHNLILSGEAGKDMSHSIFTDLAKTMRVAATYPADTTNLPKIHLFKLKFLNGDWYFERPRDFAIFKFVNKINDSTN